MLAMNARHDDDVVQMLVWATIIGALVMRYRRGRSALTACGTAAWMTEKGLRAWGMLGDRGLVLGRTAAGALIRLPRYCHTLLVGGTGAGKGVSVVIPNMLDYRRGGMVVFDCKGDLFETFMKSPRSDGRRVIRLSPFKGGEDRMNPLDTIPAGSPLLIDSAAALAESLVVRSGTNEPHWDDKASQTIKAVLVFVLLKLKDEERNLNSVQDICSDPKTLLAIGERLAGVGGIPGRCGNHIKALFDGTGLLTKEGSGVASTIARHLQFADSEMVAASLSGSTFAVSELMDSDAVLFVQIPPDQLEAQKGYLRCIISTLVRTIGASGSEEKSEVLFLLDEASALGNLSAVEEALVRGRSAGVRLLLAYQSHSQVEAAFPDKRTLIYDNCGSQIYLCPPGSLETAERLSKSLGDFTRYVDGQSENTGWSRNTDGQGGGSFSGGSSTSRSQQGRPLLRPEEILTMDEDYLIAMHRGLPGPVLAKRVKWYEDGAFSPDAPKRRRWRWGDFRWLAWAALVAALLGLAVRAKVNGTGYWTPETKRR